jgi:CRISPR type III-A-associated RAMP protein Csm4
MMSDQFRISLKSIGKITQLPDSQKIFGALMGLLSENSGDVTTSDLVRSIREGKSELALSSLIPQGYLPTPKEYFLQRKQEADDAFPEKEIREEFKRRDFIKIESFQEMDNTHRMLEKVFPYIHLDFTQQIRTSIDSDRFDIPGLENNLYSIPGIFVTKVDKQEDEEKQQTEVVSSLVSDFNFFLTIGGSISEKKLITALETAEKERHVFILGKRASQGYNLYETVSVEKWTPPKTTNTNETLNLGMLLPCENSINYKSLRTVIRLFTSERRPFENPYGWDAHSFEMQRKIISYIAEGSVLRWNEDVAKKGHSIPSPFNKERDILFGCAFQYPIDVN